MTRITYEEFADDMSNVFERVAHGDEIIVIEREDGEAVILMPARTNGQKYHKRTASDYEAFVSSFGSWSDVDVDALLKNIYGSRNMPGRPPVEL